MALSTDYVKYSRSGYLLLADKILPGLTNAAGRPRYFSVMCAATLLAPPGAGNHRSDLRMRAERVLLFERFWAAANVLASERDGELSASGIRGVTYAQAHVRLLKEIYASYGSRRTNSAYYPYGYSYGEEKSIDLCAFAYLRDVLFRDGTLKGAEAAQLEAVP